MLVVTFSNGKMAQIPKDKFTECRYDGKCIVVTKDGNFIAIYNMDAVAAVEMVPEEPAKEPEEAEEA